MTLPHPAQHYEKDSDGLSARLTRPLVKKGGLELVCHCHHPLLL
jgi:hypothetical protein